MGGHLKAPSGGIASGAGGAAPWDGGRAPGSPCAAGDAADIPGSEQRAIGAPPHMQATPEAARRADCPAPTAMPRAIRARFELDGDMVGTYMRDAIERGGYRAALEHYCSAESEKSDMAWHRFKAKGWLLGRLGHYDRVKSWLEEGADWPDFDLLLSTAVSAPDVAYRAPPLWLETPRPVPLSTDCMMSFEPVAPACPDLGLVPDCIWAVMLVLDATGPLYSSAGLGAALSLVAAGPGWRGRRPFRNDGQYDPCRGARLHGAPDGCHRWIVADIDFDPRPSNEPHFYYDLTDEGRGALADAKRAGATWQRATEAGAAGLAGMDLPDLLENACSLGAPARSLDRMRGELGRLVDAWRAQEDGRRPPPPVGAADQVLVDLGLTAKWSESGETAGSSLDHLLYLMDVVDSTHAVACEAEPSTGAERAVLQALIAAIQGQCRKHGRAVAAASSAAGPSSAPACSSCAEQGGGMRRRRPPPYTDTTPPLISDLYYCLAEYCRSRRLAVDPFSLPLSEVLTDDKRAELIKVLLDDSVFHHGAD